MEERERERRGWIQFDTIVCIRGMDVLRSPKLLEGMEVQDTHDGSVKRGSPSPRDVFVKIKRRKLVFSTGNGAPVPSRQKEHGP